jgi:hypothetical protein
MNFDVLVKGRGAHIVTAPALSNFHKTHLELLLRPGRVEMEMVAMASGTRVCRDAMRVSN